MFWWIRLYEFKRNTSFAVRLIILQFKLLYVTVGSMLRVSSSTFLCFNIFVDRKEDSGKYFYGGDVWDRKLSAYNLRLDLVISAKEWWDTLAILYHPDKVQLTLGNVRRNSYQRLLKKYIFVNKIRWKILGRLILLVNMLPIFPQLQCPTAVTYLPGVFSLNIFMINFLLRHPQWESDVEINKFQTMG